MHQLWSHLIKKTIGRRECILNSPFPTAWGVRCIKGDVSQIKGGGGKGWAVELKLKMEKKNIFWDNSIFGITNYNIYVHQRFLTWGHHYQSANNHHKNEPLPWSSSWSEPLMSSPVRILDSPGDVGVALYLNTTIGDVQCGWACKDLSKTIYLS